MAPIFRMFRVSNTLKGLEEKHIEFAWAAVSEARRMLVDYPRPDTFPGRKAQEPFPSEDDASGR